MGGIATARAGIFNPAAGGPTFYLPNATLVPGVGGSVSVDLERDGDGVYSASVSGSLTFDWQSPNGTTVGDDYEARMVMSSGDMSGGDATNTWLRLNLSRSWVGQFGDGFSTGVLTIRVYPGGATVATATINTETG